VVGPAASTSDFFASSLVRARAPVADGAVDAVAAIPGARAGTDRAGELGARALGFLHLATGLWLMYLTWATALNLAAGFHLPL